MKNAREDQRLGDETYLRELRTCLMENENTPLSGQERIILLTMLDKPQPRLAFVEELKLKRKRLGDTKVGSRRLFEDVKEQPRFAFTTNYMPRPTW